MSQLQRNFLSSTSVLVFLCLVNFINCHDFPTDIPKCKLSDSSCMTNAVQFVIKNFGGTGYPGLNLVKFDPLHIDTVYKSGPTEETRFLITNSDLGGLKNSKVVKTEFVRKGNAIKGLIQLVPPIVTLNGDYEIAGRILVVPTEGKGNYTVSLDKPNVVIKFIGKLVKNGDQEYLKLDKFRIQFTANQGKINFANLFNGDKVLGDTVNQFLNFNFKDILNAFNRILFEIFSEFLKKLTQDVFDHVPFDQMFLPE